MGTIYLTKMASILPEQLARRIVDVIAYAAMAGDPVKIEAFVDEEGEAAGEEESGFILFINTMSDDGAWNEWRVFNNPEFDEENLPSGYWGGPGRAYKDAPVATRYSDGWVMVFEAGGVDV